jgi:hypothetical protein
MLSVPPTIWNEIAETQPLKHSEMKRLMQLDHNELPAALDLLAREQETAGALPRATLAYATVAPLLLENEAIRRCVEMKDSDSLRVGLPKVATVHEALELATLEYRLSRKEQGASQPEKALARVDRQRDTLSSARRSANFSAESLLSPCSPTRCTRRRAARRSSCERPGTASGGRPCRCARGGS